MNLRFGSADEAGLRRDGLIEAYAALVEGAREDAFAGAVALVARHGVIAGFWAIGMRRVTGPEVAITHDAVFDLASLTKALVAAPVTLRLADEGRLALDSPLERYLPWTAGSYVGEACLRQLLTHTAGLPPSADIGWAKEPPARHGELLASIGTEPREGVVYSDLGYYLLGLAAEAAAGEGLGRIFGRIVQAPLGLFGSGYGPVDPALRPIVPTESLQGQVLEGVVHDGKARLMAKPAGHAGLFAPALDVALFAQALLSGGEGRLGRMLPSPSVDAMLRPATDGPEPRSLGLFYWGERDGTGFSLPAWGHTGFTGTSFAVDPRTELLAVLLASRVHPQRRPEERLKRVRARFHRAVWQSIRA